MDDGSLWIWGSGSWGQIGDGRRRDCRVPKKVLTHVAQFSFKGTSCAAVKTDGSLWMWGLKLLIGVGEASGGMCLSPVRIMEDVQSVSLQDSHTLAVTKDGNLWGWGCSNHGEAGSPSDYVSKPERIMCDIAFADAGEGRSAALTVDRRLFTWGINDVGELGNGTVESSSVPLEILDEVTDVAICQNHAIALRGDGSLWTWGDNCHGQLGNGEAADELTPARIFAEGQWLYGCEDAIGEDGLLQGDYLSSRTSGDLAADVANDLVMGVLRDVAKNGMEAAEMITEEEWKLIKEIKGARGKVEKYRSKVDAVIAAGYYLCGTNNLEMYNYYLAYRNSLYAGEYADLLMDAYRYSDERAGYLMTRSGC